MDVFQAIKQRRSVRKFDHTKVVSDEQIRKLLEAANLAPSAGNIQSYFLYVVKNPQLKRELYEAAGEQNSITESFFVIVACADLNRSKSKYDKRGEELYAIQDPTIALQNLCLTATEMGLGSVWIGGFNENKVREALEIPEHLRPISMMPIGYPAESPEPKTRRELDDISIVI